ncbi:MAG: metal-dependent hydrolase [Paracoccaceae bacterium]
MLTAHLPSGYLLARGFRLCGRLALGTALLRAVFPDFDMIAFHLIDDRAIHHHRYWFHIPLFWTAVAAVALPVVWRTTWRLPGAVFFAGVFLHLFLDTISGGIMWGAPFSDHLFAFVTVPPVYGNWVTNFVLHWTFLLEIAV